MQRMAAANPIRDLRHTPDMALRPVHEMLTTLEAGTPVRIPVSRSRALGVLALGIVVGLGLLAVLGLIVVETDDVALLLASLRVWAVAISAVACLTLLPVSIVVRLSRREVLVIGQEGVTEVRQGRPVATIPWRDIAHVNTTTISSYGPLPGKPVVTYTVTPQARERIEHECAATGRRPPWVSQWQPGVVIVSPGYVLGPKRLAELLETARRRHS